MKILIPILGILAGTALVAMNMVDMASAQTASEYALIISLLNNAHFKNQGQCISQLPDIVLNAQVAPDLSSQQKVKMLGTPYPYLILSSSFSTYFILIKG